jgi:hypothetical protein
VLHAQAVFAADENHVLLERLKGGLSTKALKLHMNIDRVPLFILTSNKILEPIISRTAQEPIFDPLDADRLLSDLGRSSVSVAELTGSRMGISAATKRANCSLLETIRLMLEGELKWVGRLREERGFRALLIDSDELRTKVALPPMPGIVPSALCRILGIRGSAIKRIIEAGLLKTEMTINPANRCPQEVVPPTALKEFTSVYVSLRDIARQKGHLSARVTLKELADLGVHPDELISSFGAYMFLRSDIA